MNKSNNYNNYYELLNLKFNNIKFNKENLPNK
jgi:hypothetical protein